MVYLGSNRQSPVDVWYYMNPTQTRILHYLKDHPAASAAEISRALGMTVANIRYHLNSLETAGSVEVEISTIKKGRGHPVHLYHLSTLAQQHNLGCLAEILLTELINQANPEAGTSLADTLADRLIQNGSQLALLHLKQAPLTQYLTNLAQALEPFHYQARWEAHPASPHFIFAQCPYRVIVDRHPILCQMDARLLEKMLSRPVKQIARIGQGTPTATSCIFEIARQRPPTT
jgi:predicted ArsR family transcriptional regulator